MSISEKFSFEGSEFTITIDPWPLTKPQKTSVVVAPGRGFRVFDGNGLTVCERFDGKKAFVNLDDRYLSFRIVDPDRGTLVEESISGVDFGKLEPSEIRFHSKPGFVPSTDPEFALQFTQGQGQLDLYHHSGHMLSSHNLRKDVMKIAEESYVYRMFKTLSSAI